MKTTKTKRNYWYKRLTISNWLTILGGLIIFCSWLVEKKLQNKWTEEKEKLKRSQIVIDITENARASYEIAYYSEAQKTLKDTAQLAFLQQRLARVYLDLLTWSKGRVTDNAKEYEDLIKSKRQIDEENRTCLAKKDYKIINKNFNIVVAVFGQKYMQFDNDFSNKVDIVEANEDKWTTIFTYLYIFGSILLGLSYVNEKAKQKKEE